VLDPALGIGSLGEGEGHDLEVPKVPSEGQEEGDEWVLPERAYSDHEGEEVVPHEQEEEGVPVEVPVEQDAVEQDAIEQDAVEQDAASEAEEGYKEPTSTPSMPNEEDPFADNSADISAAEVEAQLEVSDEEPAKGEEMTEVAVGVDGTVAEATVVEAPVDEAPVDEAPVEKAQVEVQGPEAVNVPKLDDAGKDVIEEDEKKD